MTERTRAGGDAERRWQLGTTPRGILGGGAFSYERETPVLARPRKSACCLDRFPVTSAHETGKAHMLNLRDGLALIPAFLSVYICRGASTIIGYQGGAFLRARQPCSPKIRNPPQLRLGYRRCTSTLSRLVTCTSGRAAAHDLQGYLAHKKSHRPRTSQSAYAWDLTVIIWRGAVSYARGNPVTDLTDERKPLHNQIFVSGRGSCSGFR